MVLSFEGVRCVGVDQCTTGPNSARGGELAHIRRGIVPMNERRRSRWGYMNT